MDLAAIHSYITSLDGCLVVGLALSVLTAVLCEFFNRVVMKAVCKKSWWPSAEQLQKHLMMSFGFKEELCTPQMNLEAFAFVVVVSANHFITGSMMFPVVALGWSEAGESLQLLFLMATLFHLGFDVYDTIKRTTLTFWPQHFKWLGDASPLTYWVIQCCCHHPLTLLLIVPMNLKYSYLPQYHKIACALLLAAGICFMAGQYKFTLNVTKRRDFVQYKVIVLLQFLTVWFTRCIVWFPNSFSLLSFFHEQGDTPFFFGGIIGTTGMSLFNIVMLLDATAAALKWLPMPLPASGAEHEHLKAEIAREQGKTILPSSPTTSASLAASSWKVAMAGVQRKGAFEAPLLVDHQTTP